MRHAFLTVILLLMLSTIFAQTGKRNKVPYTESFSTDSCRFSSTGKNTYFLLMPGFQTILQGADGKDSAKLVITVLNETRVVGGIETRIVEERESVNGKIVEISRNYFAFCTSTSTVYYFGEEVDIYKDGVIVEHSGAWVAEGNNKAGIIMPGEVLLGARYYQEIAPGMAMDRAEIVSFSETFETPAGTFQNVLKTKEGTALNPKEMEYKLYAPGIGLIKDEELVLVSYGFIK